ncbi:hypothetical protein ATE84_2901 [Aquimarina sp. MAR_2010_214]|uniref:hypothetical protein n=1 Tax=Aquimarina sp. MAR_2010_214 TaxID=1250026 RepID=UPI000C6FD8E7|nr:hypothetical protein [Aquimarina sp. MAR_2010_214]PKV50834.1 hypothetical protein ATE84_2901 [Aquimarina sp. MAR_2010_214]
MIRNLVFILLIGSGVAVQSQDRKTLYNNTLDELHCVLKDSCTLSFKKAVMQVENAYLHGTLDTIAFNDDIALLKQLANTLVANKNLQYSERDSLKVKEYAAIFSVITDTIPIVMEDGLLYDYIPYGYDFEDIWGIKSWKNMFVSKLLETRKGNCHSLPYLYKILAEEMEVDAHLALAPNHVYIKHKNLKDGWYNTELTSGIFPMDAWLMASGYIHLDAISNKLYMEALDDKQSIAMCVIDLAEGYNRAFPANDGLFVFKACQIALKYYPHYINGRILLAETKKKMFEQQVEDKFGTFTKEVYKDERFKAMFLDMQNDYASIHQSGYRRMPEKMYLQWLTSLNEERARYENKKITNHK